MDTERARNPDTETERGRQTQRGGRGSEWQPQRIETGQPSHPALGGEDGGGPRDALPPQLPLEPWACAALGSSPPHPPSRLPRPHLTRQWPQGHLPRWGAGVPLASFPSARSSPSVATDGGAAGQDPAGLPASPPALFSGHPRAHCAPQGMGGWWWPLPAAGPIAWSPESCSGVAPSRAAAPGCSGSPGTG